MFNEIFHSIFLAYIDHKVLQKLSLHFSHSAFTLYVTSSSIFSSLLIIELRDRIESLCNISWVIVLKLVLALCSYRLKLHFIYFIFVLIFLRPLDSKALRHLFSFLFTLSLDWSTNTILYSNKIHQVSLLKYKQLTHKTHPYTFSMFSNSNCKEDSKF